MAKIHILHNNGNYQANPSSLTNNLVLQTITQARISSWDNKIGEEELNSTVNSINGKISSVNRDIEALTAFENATVENIENIKTELNDLSELVGLMRDEDGSNDDYFSTLLQQIQKINNFIDDTYDSKIIEINNKIDNKADSYVQEDFPHPEYRNVAENITYNAWLGDIWRKTSTEVDYKYIRKQNDDGTFDYIWESQNSSIPDSLFDMIDGKASIYFSKPSSYNKRDCWILESDEIHPPNKMGTLLFANKSNTKYNADDWIDLAKYVTQNDYNLYVAQVNNFINKTYTDEIKSINSKLDNKAESYVQENRPHEEYSNISENNEYNNWLGDIWRKPSTGADYKYLRSQNDDGTFNYYWELQTTSIPDSLFDRIDGKASIYFSKPTSYNAHDCWILENDTIHPPNKKGTLLFASASNSVYTETDWVDLVTYVTQSQYEELQTKINNFIDSTYTNEIKSINSKIDNKADSYVQENKPHEEYNNVSNNNTYNGWLGDIWRKTSTGVDYKYVKTANSNGTYNYIWETQSANIPDTLYDKIDGKASIYFAKPQTYNVHDCWILESDTIHSPQKKGTLLFANKSNTSYDASDWVDLVTYVTDADIDDKVSDVTTKYQELSDRFSWLVSSSSSASSLVITDKLIQAISTSNIQLSAKKILINGLLEGAGWRVDEEGNLEVNDLNIIGTLTCKNFSTENVVTPSIGQILDSDKNYYVDSSKNITDVLDDIPLNLNGYKVNIYFNGDVTDTVTLRRHTNGQIKIFMCGHTLFGYIHTSFNNSIYELYGGSTESDTTKGKIMPYDGYTLGSYVYSILCTYSSNIIMKNITIYGDKTNTSKNVGVGATRNTNIIMDNISFVGCRSNCRTYSLSKIHCDGSSGKATGVGWYAGTGSTISFGTGTQAGGLTNTDTGNNGQILSSGVSFSSNTDSGSNSNSGGTTTTKSITYYPNYSDTYRSSVYNSWKKDGVAKQGRWTKDGAESGNCNGYFFFGTQFSELKDCTIKKVEITLTRKSGVGNSASCSHGVYWHTYTERPSGTPSMTSCSTSVSLGWGDTGTATITNTDVLNKISNGTIKGFGIKSTYDASHYSAISTCKVKIYYTGELKD